MEQTRPYHHRECKRRRIGGEFNPVRTIDKKRSKALRASPKDILGTYGFRFHDPSCEVGSGKYSFVLQGFQMQARRKFAIKVTDMEQVSRTYRVKFMPREIECWKRLNHPNLCYLYQNFEQHNYQFAIMELAVTDLLTYIQNHGAVPEKRAHQWMKQMVNALVYMHSLRIAHRDLKPENVLIFANNLIKIGDFGFCKQSIDLSETFCGSKSYSAPEILEGVAYDPFQVDVWSLGVIAFVMVTNMMPFQDDTAKNEDIVEAQLRRNYRYPSQSELSLACRRTIDTMLTFDPDKRPTIVQCKSLPWITGTRAAAFLRVD